MPHAKLSSALQAFLTQSRRLNGAVVREREPWHTEVTADAIRHFAYGISDDNPRWVSSEYATQTRLGRLVAPPTFLCSVLYPVLHGAAVSAPLSNLIVEIGFEWYEPVSVGDRLTAEARQLDAVESRDRDGRPAVLILSEVRYRNQRGIPVARAEATLARVSQPDGELRLTREVYRYDDQERHLIAAAQRDERRRGMAAPAGNEIAIGDELPTLVRGPLTIGDLVAWQAGIGPSYRPGSLGYQDTLKAPHSTVLNPVTGWPVKDSQQHEDVLLAPQRGMPAPFDNGVMRFAWLSPLLTNWIGDDGWLETLSVQLTAPNLYGDTTWYRGRVARVVTGEEVSQVTVDITGTNQLGDTTTTGTAVVRLPSMPRQPPNARDTVARGERDTSDARRVDAPSVLAQLTRQVELEPAAVAVSDADTELTYGQLSARAATLATRLASRGVRRGHYVGVCLPRSTDWIVSVLAVLRAGAAFVPLDPDYPEPRLSAMTAQVQPSLVVTCRDLRGRLPVGPDRTLCLDDGAFDTPIDAAVLSGAEPGDPAYVVFTSGTTGTPNGVVVSQRTFGRYVAVVRGALDVAPTDVYLHTAPFAFSASMRQVFVPLSAGARLVIADESQQHDPLALFDLMRARRVSVWDTVPSVCGHAMSTVAETATPGLAPSLRLIALTGEPLSWDVPALVRDLAESTPTVANLYSHSETAGTVGMFVVASNSVERSHGPVPLGWSVEGSTLYVLDDDHQRQAPGQPGEIWVGGDRLADGYLNNPELTRERFVEDPFRDTPTARMFRTGDVGRLRADGAVELVGRSDQRVNIHGRRIEPAEVESALVQHPGVSRVAVVGKDDPEGRTCLVAYVVPTSRDSAVSSRSLREHLARHVPVFMVPSAFEVRDTLPVGPNGKIDRHALPEPDWPHPDPTAEYHAPVSQLERRLAGIWADVLNVDRVGLHQDFLDLRGDSISAMLIVNRIRSELGLDLPQMAMFAAPTVAQLAALIEHGEP